MSIQRSHRVETFSYGLPWEESHGYSQAFRIGDEIRISGQMPHDDQGELIGPGDLVRQTAAVLANLDRVLAEFGLGRRQIVETGIYIVKLQENFASVSAAHREYFGGHKPTSSAFGVSELVLPGQLVEITAVARADLRR